MVNLKKKEIYLKEIFKTYFENSGINDKLYDSINCYIKNDYKIINNTNFSWCFTPKGFYKYNLIRGLKDNIEGLLYTNNNTKVTKLKGEQSYIIELDVDNVYDIY